ncbi:MAG: FAD-dependent oxidoreductase [Gammaproteobacteria bacterium]
MIEPQRIAVVGSGIAGIAAAWLLGKWHSVWMFERNRYFGGHTHTVTVTEQGQTLPIDTGFIVYNEPNYPHLTGLFNHLGIATRETEMTFAASVGNPVIEFAGSDLNTLFAQRRNLVNGGFLGMVWDILRFNRRCKALLREHRFGNLTVGDLLEQERLGVRFRDHYLLPMAAAIWSCPPRTMLDFPAQSFARFFENHGLLDLYDRPQWKTVVGGSHSYIKRLLEEIGPRARLADAAVSVSRKKDRIEVTLASGERMTFDQVVLACHADEALALLTGPLTNEQSILSRFDYQPNRALLHTDERLMPRSRRVWSSWNYLAEQDGAQVEAVSVTYWMNRLQGIRSEREFFVSLNPLREPRPDRLIAEMTYHHPVFDTGAMAAQQRLAEIQGLDRIWYTGSYFGYGFHEDALRASVELAEGFGIRAPWVSRRGRAAWRGPCNERPAPVLLYPRPPPSV